MLKFKTWLVESVGKHEDFSNLKPYHSYKTDSGHDVDVHILNEPEGKKAVYFNNDLGVITKLATWSHNSELPSKDELEQLGKDKKKIDENENLNEATTGGNVTPDTAGKIAERAAALQLIHYKHEQSKTVGSPKHKAEAAEHNTALASLSKGLNKDQVALRIKHGQEMGHAAFQSLKSDHGPKFKLKNVSLTSKSGDIGRFTGGKHNDGQENPSDVSVEVANSDKTPHDAKESHFEGFSLKSSSKSSAITAKNPAIHLNGMLDVPTREFKAEKVAREGLNDLRRKLGHGGKTASEMAKHIADARQKEGVSSNSSIEQKANELAGPVKKDVIKELHSHLSHLTENGHHAMIGNMLRNHLTQPTSMPWKKIHAQGHKEDNVRATVTSGSESEMNHLFKNKKTNYAVTRSDARVTIHKVNKDGTHTPLVHYSPKPKSNAAKENTMGWNVIPVNTH